MSAETLISKLDGVRRTGPDRWMAKCPAHDDRSPSLSITEKDNGTVLVKCFAECATENVLSAVGLGFDALYPEKSSGHAPRVKRPWHIGDPVRGLEFELTIAFLFLGDIAHGRPVTDEDRSRALESQERIVKILGELSHAAR